MPEPRYIYRELSYANPVSQHVGSVDFLTPIGHLQNLNDQADDMGHIVKPVNALAPDIHRRNQIMDYYKNKLGEIADYESPYERLRGTKKLAQQYIDDLHQGELGSIASNHANEQEYIKHLQEAVNKGNISQRTAENLLAISKDKYAKQNGIGERNSLGAYNGYTNIDPNKEINIQEVADKAAQGIIADKVKSGQWKEVQDPKGQGRIWIKNDGSKKYVTYDEVYNIAKQGLLSHPEFEGHIKQQHLIHSYGKDNPIDYNTYRDSLIDPHLNAVANKYSFQENEFNQEHKYHDDPLALYKAKIGLEDEINNNLVNTKSTSKYNVEAPLLVPEGLSFDSKGKAIDPTKPNPFDPKYYTTLHTYGGGKTYNKEAYEKDLENWKAAGSQEELHKNIEETANKLGLNLNLSQKEKYNAILEHQKANKERTITEYIGTPKVQEYLTDLVFRNGNFASSEFKVGNQEFKNIDDFAGYLLKNKDEFLPSDIDTIGEVKEYIRKNATVAATTAGNGRYNSINSAAHVGSLNGHEFLVSSDEQTSKALSPVNQLQKQIYNPKESGKPVEFVGSDGEPSYFTVKFNNGNYEVKLTDDKGNLIPEFKNYNFDLQELGTTVLKNYQKSRYSSAIHSGRTKQEDQLGE